MSVHSGSLAIATAPTGPFHPCEAGPSEAPQLVLALNLLLQSSGKFQKTSFTLIYTSYVITHLDLNIQACPPILSRDSLVLERVQRRYQASERALG